MSADRMILLAGEISTLRDHAVGSDSSWLIRHDRATESNQEKPSPLIVEFAEDGLKIVVYDNGPSDPDQVAFIPFDPNKSDNLVISPAYKDQMLEKLVGLRTAMFHIGKGVQSLA
jgi:hypothetical protein